MASPEAVVASHYANCKRHRPYKTMREAKHARKATGRKKTHHVYLCWCCQKWHIGGHSRAHRDG